MKFIDPRAKRHLRRYAVQCLLAALTILGVMLSLNVLFQAGIIATLGATTFIVFAMPRAPSSRLRPLLGGYAWGTVIGVACSGLAHVLGTHVGLDPTVVAILFGACAVGASIFAMLVTGTQHPPAAGLALSLWMARLWSQRRWPASMATAGYPALAELSAELGPLGASARLTKDVCAGDLLKEL